MAKILVLGATGYVGSRLTPALIDAGHDVTCLVRDPGKIPTDIASQCRLIKGDVLSPETLDAAIDGVDLVYYLIHSMGAGQTRFEDLDRTAAANVSRAAAAGGVSRIIYLGGLGKKGADQSPHLRSRHEVAERLGADGIPVTEFRAAVIVGAGGISFEMIHHLVNRLPFMICPRWVNMKTQPIAVGDVVKYLVACANKPETAGQVIDIGGPEILTYRDMMLTVARILRLRRFLVQVPVLTPRLSSYWVKWVTPLPASTARALIESVRSETIRENDLADRLFDIEPECFADAARRALARVLGNRNIPDDIETRIDPSHFLLDERTVDIDAPAGQVFDVVCRIGGDTGWYFADWLWRLRGAIDRLLGGIGLRRGRRHPTELAVGDTVDFWRVEAYVPGSRLLLDAEMNVWGRAWLEFTVTRLSDGRTRLRQTARYYPRGLFGLVYWYTVYPLHQVVFRGMIKSIARRAVTPKRQHNM